MITRLGLVTILVRDQEEALRWFTEILGLEKRQDASFGKGPRWLVVAQGPSP
jgi:catechol 2,3-dioxygenase-like lactoylglutathione lyase family enzyme